MKVLFLHPNMPGQYKHLCTVLARDPENQVVFLTKRKNVQIPGVRRVLYNVTREGTPKIHRYLSLVERGVLHGQEVWRTCRKMKAAGFVPDVICAHPGWGDALYLKEIYPDAPILSFFEFYYRGQGSDVGFDPAEPANEDDLARVRTKNIINLLSLEQADWGISPTRWQWRQHPPEFRHKISVLHDGIDTDFLTPDENAAFALPNGKTMTAQDEIVTYIARNFEPYRGFPTFMQAAEIILRKRPNAQIVAIGADGVSYGKRLPKGQSYRDIWREKVALDPARIHFTGTLPYDQLVQAMQVSSAHLYLTYPFVLSWSMLEAMSVGCLVVGSNTAPVTEVIEDGKNGLLVDFFSPEKVAERVCDALEHKSRYHKLRAAARATIVERYDLKKLLPLHIGLVRDLAAGNIPPLTAERIG